MLTRLRKELKLTAAFFWGDRGAGGQRTAKVLAFLTLSLVCLSLEYVPAQAAAPDALVVLLDDREQDYLRLHPSIAITRGDRRYLDRFETDLTNAYLAEERRLHEIYAARLDAIDRAALSADERISYDMLRWELETEEGFLEPNISETLQQLPINQIWSRYLDFAREMQWSSTYPFNTPEDYESAISRMEGFGGWIDQAILRMREGTERGITLPRVVVERVIAQTAPLSNPDAERNGFLGPVANMPDTIRGADRERLGSAYRNAVEGTVLPAFARLHRFLSDEYLAAARVSVGLSAIPHGREIYRRNTRSSTTTDLEPDAIYALGLSEVARIEAEMMRIVAETGFTGDLQAFKAYLRSAPDFEFANDAAMLEAFASVKEAVEPRLNTVFDDLPEAELELVFVADYAQQSSPLAFYSPPAPGGARPGLLYLNPFDLPSRRRFNTEALFLHEALPGHHVQLSLSVENERLPAFRRYAAPVAFVEGWALYAESLGPELGLYTDPYSRFGALSFAAWRAARLVVDTGIHWLDWTREEGIAYLLAHTALSETEAAAEVDRYIAIPGQALGYKIGELKFLELRAHAQAILGDGFELRRFHTALLDAGAMPLPILEEKMNGWIAAEQKL